MIFISSRFAGMLSICTLIRYTADLFPVYRKNMKSKYVEKNSPTDPVTLTVYDR